LNLPTDTKTQDEIRHRVELVAYQVSAFVESTNQVVLTGVVFQCVFMPESSAGEALCKLASDSKAELLAVGSRGLSAIKVSCWTFYAGHEEGLTIFLSSSEPF
jgi:hypothetical protein